MDYEPFKEIELIPKNKNLIDYFLGFDKIGLIISVRICSMDRNHQIFIVCSNSEFNSHINCRTAKDFFEMLSGSYKYLLEQPKFLGLLKDLHSLFKLHKLAKYTEEMNNFMKTHPELALFIEL